MTRVKDELLNYNLQYTIKYVILNHMTVVIVLFIDLENIFVP